MRLRHIFAGVALVTAIGAVAYAQHGGHGAMMTPAEMQKMMDDMMPKDTDSPSTRAFKEAHMKMMKSMHITFSGNANVDFVRGMIPHHQGAIDMAKVMLQYGSDQQIKAMAQKIIDDQQREIAEMQAWLKKNGQ